MKDAPRPEWVNGVISDKDIITVQEFILQNRNIKLEEIAWKINVIIGSAYNILSNTWSTSSQLSPELKQRRIVLLFYDVKSHNDCSES